MAGDQKEKDELRAIIKNLEEKLKGISSSLQNFHYGWSDTHHHLLSFCCLLWSQNPSKMCTTTHCVVPLSDLSVISLFEQICPSLQISSPSFSSLVFVSVNDPPCCGSQATFMQCMITRSFLWCLKCSSTAKAIITVHPDLCNQVNSGSFTP